MIQFNPFWFSEMLDKVFGRKKYEKEIPLVKQPAINHDANHDEEVMFWAIIVIELVWYLVLIIIFVVASVSR